MDIIHAVKNFLSSLVSRARPSAESTRPGTEAALGGAEERGLKSRCVNPDHGCRFEVS
jgi:hypothetical protein